MDGRRAGYSKSTACRSVRKSACSRRVEGWGAEQGESLAAALKGRTALLAASSSSPGVSSRLRPLVYESSTQTCPSIRPPCRRLSAADWVTWPRPPCPWLPVPCLPLGP